MAGLWNRWIPATRQAGVDAFDDDGPARGADATKAFAIITTQPNDAVKLLHDRPAVILSADEKGVWLDGGTVPLDPRPAGEMRTHPVSTTVANPPNDSPKLLREGGV